MESKSVSLANATCDLWCHLRGQPQFVHPAFPLHSGGLRWAALCRSQDRFVPAAPAPQCRGPVRRAMARISSAHTSLLPAQTTTRAEDSAVLVLAIGRRNGGTSPPRSSTRGPRRGRKVAFPPPGPRLRANRNGVIKEV